MAAQGVAHAAELLAGHYHLVITNVPYLTRGKQGKALRDFCEQHYSDAKPDLATVFVERCLSFCTPGGSAALVTPQNWLFLTSYKNLRKRLLQNQTWNSVEYTHGGLSVQECVAMELTVTQQGASGSPATIAAVRWSGLRCRVRVEGAAPDLRVDIRTRAADPSTSITAARHVNAEGPTALLVEDDRYEGVAAVVVLLTADGRVIDRQPTTVGE